MRLLNSPILAMFFLLAFSMLAYASLNREVGYTHSIFDVLPQTFHERQSSVLMELWHISEDEINKPIAIFGKE